MQMVYNKYEYLYELISSLLLSPFLRLRSGY